MNDQNITEQLDNLALIAQEYEEITLTSPDGEEKQHQLNAIRNIFDLIIQSRNKLSDQTDIDRIESYFHRYFP